MPGGSKALITLGIFHLIISIIEFYALDTTPGSACVGASSGLWCRTPIADLGQGLENLLLIWSFSFEVVVTKLKGIVLLLSGLAKMFIMNYGILSGDGLLVGTWSWVIRFVGYALAANWLLGITGRFRQN